MKLSTSVSSGCDEISTYMTLDTDYSLHYNVYMMYLCIQGSQSTEEVDRLKHELAEVQKEKEAVLSKCTDFDQLTSLKGSQIYNLIQG